MAISKIYQFCVKISIKILPIFAVSGSKYWNFEPLLQFCHVFESIRLLQVGKISIVALLSHFWLNLKCANFDRNWSFFDSQTFEISSYYHIVSPSNQFWFQNAAWSVLAHFRAIFASSKGLLWQFWAVFITDHSF